MGTSKQRITRLIKIFCLLFIIVGLRLFWLQIIDNNQYEESASRQQTRSLTLKAHRGEILVHEKQDTVPIASTKDAWLLSIDPRKIEDPATLYGELMKILPIAMPKEEFIKKASKKDDPYEIIEHRIANSVKQSLEQAKLKGVSLAQESWRFYPAGRFASQTIGFVNTEDVGQYGLERYYDRDLTGQDGVFRGDKTVGGDLILLGKKITKPEKNGVNIVLTIDSGVQAHLEQVINDVYKTYSAQSAGGLIIQPKTGKILALASIPTFDPNTYSKENNIAIFKNPIVESLFEMGSVIKPLTLAAALDVRAITLTDTYVDTGKRTIDGKTIENYDGKARGRVSMQEILSQSLNLGAVHVMETLGREKFRSYMQAYGINERTGIDLPNEAVGNLKNLESSRLIEYATASFGQGISMTFLELARALSSLANGGFLVNPYIVEELRYDNGAIIAKKQEEPKHILKSETSKTITRMLVEVVDTKLAGGKGKIPGYAVAAKTGTAQIALAGSRGYSTDFMHTFFGYAPAYDPQFLVVLYVERPQGIRYASESLTEPFHVITQHLFSYYEVPPDRPQELTR
jgi:cell division protein FtsI/penicillin-binding protein 2